MAIGVSAISFVLFPSNANLKTLQTLSLQPENIPLPQPPTNTIPLQTRLKINHFIVLSKE
jgi:hypothetical protein